jgi:monovalent cation:H+ antiporter-2, CPA2 family
MSINIAELGRYPGLLLASLAVLLATKFLLLLGLSRLFRVPRPAAIETALLLAPAGEFAFVGIGTAAGAKLIEADTSSHALVAVSLSMALIPLLSAAARRLSLKAEDAKPLAPALLEMPGEAHGHAIVVGYGRVGQVICKLLERHGFPYLATDRDPRLVSRLRPQHRNLYFGDASNPQFLKRCGLGKAGAVIVSINEQAAIDEIVAAVRPLRPDIVIVSRARDAAHARHLYAVGVTDAVPETIEASLQLSEAALVSLGLPAGPVIASIHELRDESRNELQQAARQAGLLTTRSIRRKTLRK